MPFERRLERIEVKGGQAVIQEVLTSRHGTVFNSLVRQPRAGEAYLCYDAQTMDAGASARMMLEVLDAGNWTEFRRALEHYYYPGLHIVYADVEGNVGYHTLVHRPLTARSPRRALEGWTGRDEVRGRIPLDELPHMLNPEAGYISHANNLPVGSWYPYDLGLATGGTGDTGRSCGCGSCSTATGSSRWTISSGCCIATTSIRWWPRCCRWLARWSRKTR